ncbi:siderophore-iron reductase FhuF [Calothrix membranacea FACHB-236]|nr:siderophore-iron reductase FhuF [Calothrix membranacea FACHB-236]
MSQSLISSNVRNFVEEIFSHAQSSLDNFYTECMILTQPPDDAEVMPLNDYLQPETLLSVIKARSEYDKTQDIRISASIWNKVYSWTILPGVLALMTWAGVGLDAGLENVSLILEEGQPKAVWFHDLSRTVIYPKRSPIPIPKDYPGKIVNSVDDLHQAVFTGLFQRNLAPMIDRVHSLTKLSKKTMWGNAVNASEGQFAELSQYANPEAIQTDYSVLYEQPYSVVIPGRNPLYNLIRTEQLHETNLPSKLTVRLTCCLYAFIPPYDEKCPNCPLIETLERIALMKQELLEDK